MKNLIDRQSLVCLLDSHFASYLVNESYKLVDVEPSELITSNRLDLAIKILYLEMEAIGHVFFARELYLNHIKAFSLGSFKEPGNEEKTGIQKYFDDFDGIFQRINEHGIDADISVIPLSTNGSIANGSHRVSSAYVANQAVPTVGLAVPNDKYDASFFLERGVSREAVELVVTKFIECAENCYVALIWPSAEGRENEILKLIPNIVYKSSVSLNYFGAHNLISQIYYEEAWLGERENNYPGAKNKLVECFKTFGQLRIIAFQAESLYKALWIKNEIRQIFNIGKHSIHISDTKDEAIRVARILFNHNSVHFLNFGNPNKYPSAIERIIQFKRFLAKNKIRADNVVIDSSHILSLYGLRESKDLDYLALDTNIEFEDDTIEDHLSEIAFHQEEKNELVLNSKFYFYYENLKFISFDQLYRMKKNRGETKDKNDLIMMDALIESNVIKNCVGLLKQKYYYLTAKLKLQIMAVLRMLRLYRFARYIYRLIKP